MSQQVTPHGITCISKLIVMQQQAVCVEETYEHIRTYKGLQTTEKNNKMLFAVVEAMNYMELSKYKHIAYTPQFLEDYLFDILDFTQQYGCD